jgi:hypothetical protein
MLEHDLVALPTGEIKNVTTLSPVGSVEFCEWLLEKAARANRLALEIAAGEPSSCDYWDISERAFCDRPATVFAVGEPSTWVADPPSALCQTHRILAQ